MRGLSGKRIIVAGGSTGIGAAVAARLAEEGARLIVGATSRERLDATVGRITAAGGEALAVPFDLADPQGGEVLAAACLEAYGGVDGLANIGADLSKPSITANADLLGSPEDHWRQQFDTNFMGYMRTIQAVLPHLAAQKSGSIVNTSTSSVHMGEPARPAYAAAKASVHALTRHVATRWGRDNVRCNCIAPGLVFVEKMRASMPPEMQVKMARGIPLGRGGEPEEVASAYAYLLSDDARWITGQVWAVNGGMLMRD
jgi:NAD(P)-dependent dehydrogenase (short-subunit alcohol dehydrogenase family)